MLREFGCVTLFLVQPGCSVYECVAALDELCEDDCPDLTSATEYAMGRATDENIGPQAYLYECKQDLLVLFFVQGDATGYEQYFDPQSGALVAQRFGGFPGGKCTGGWNRSVSHWYGEPVACDRTCIVESRCYLEFCEPDPKCAQEAPTGEIP